MIQNNTKNMILRQLKVKLLVKVTHTAIGQDIHLAILNIKHKKEKKNPSYSFLSRLR